MKIKSLEALLNDPGLSEFMLNGFDKAFVEWNGSMQPFPTPFKTEEEFAALIADLAKLPNTLNKNSLSFDGMLPDGSRFHVTLPPLSPGGPTLTVRRFSRLHRTLADLTDTGFMSKKMATFLDACVKAKINILISGGTGAGKTTLLNCLASLADPNERIVTIEDIPELQLKHGNWVRLLSVHEPLVISVRDCVIGALRMRPDRIIVGECRSSEALEMLQAMNTGHDGGLTTIHSNSSEDALTRLESLTLFHAGADIAIRPLRRQIADAIDLVIQVKKGAGGQRFVQEVLEVVGMEGDMITRLPIFKRPGDRSEFGKTITTGHPPRFLERLHQRGVILPKDFFDPTKHEESDSAVDLKNQLKKTS
jgi:pilus assembly protein CpaF